MAKLWATKNILDSADAAVVVPMLDKSGAGTGPFAFGHVLRDTINLVALTFSLDTAAYAAGEVLADSQALADVVFENDGEALLHSLALIDKDDQKVAMTALFFSANVSLGTENAAPSISDADAANFLCAVDVLAGDWRDLGGVAVAELSGIGKVVKAASGTKSIYVALLNGSGTPTFTASGIVGRFGFLPG